MLQNTYFFEHFVKNHDHKITESEYLRIYQFQHRLKTPRKESPQSNSKPTHSTFARVVIGHFPTGLSYFLPYSIDKQTSIL